jgi:hypothetical protein
MLQALARGLGLPWGDTPHSNRRDPERTCLPVAQVRRSGAPRGHPHTESGIAHARARVERQRSLPALSPGGAANTVSERELDHAGSGFGGEAVALLSGAMAYPRMPSPLSSVYGSWPWQAR